ILANLDHPNITRLLDAGTTNDGLPYFVMEFVEGTPITGFVQQENLALGDRLKLFLKVCSAVDFAHRHQIIHRDIKPRNVLINEEGEPKLLDFGIAKLLDPDSDGGITTLVSERRLTPMYAAPEQSAGQPATIATDVYALGELLYELLTKRKVNGVSDKSSRDATSERLTGRGTAEKTGHHLRSELDQIVTRAIQRDPAQRYSSVAGMCKDIEACLNQPTPKPFWTARRDEVSSLESSDERSTSRRRWYAVSAALSAIVLVAAVLSSTPGARWLRNARFGKSISLKTPGNTTEPVRSIAVIPFEPLGKDTNDELLGLGMADAVIGKMSSLKQFTVLPTSAVSRYKGPANDPLAAGRALGVDAILSGTIQRSADR